MAFKYNGTNVNTTQISSAISYDEVGSPTIQDGILTDISSSNYITTDTSFNTTSSFSIILKYKLLADGNLTYFIGNTDGFKFYSTSTNANNLGGMIRASSENEWTYLNVPTISHQTNTWYILQFDYNGTNTYTVTVKNESGTVLGTDTTTSNIKIAAGNICFGYNGGSAAEEIDLNNTYIYINNKLWFWQPKEANYVQTGSQLVWANPHLYLEGPNTYTKVGSPSIVDNVASGFSSNDYLTIPQSLAAGYIKTYEIFTKFTAPETFDNSSGLICTNDYNINGIYLNKETSTTATIKVASHSNNSLYTISGNVGQVTPSSTFYVWYIVDGENGTHTLKTSTDGKIYSTWGTSYTTGVYNDNTTLWNIGLGIYGVFNGSIDLNETYIKVNNNLWFYGRNNATQNIAPVPNNYTYGTTTTTGIGYVDMRTQQFKELPSGVTLGNDSNITLKRLTINAPSDSIVTINGRQTNSLALHEGDSYTYSVTKTDYKSLTGSGILNDNTTVNVTTLHININPTPDYFEVNDEQITKFLFEDGKTFNYTIYAEKAGYNNLYYNGTATTTTTFAPSMPRLTPLCFKAEEANSTLKLSKYFGSGHSIDLRYSTDLTNWTNLAVDSVVTLANVGDKIYLKGSNSYIGGTSNAYNFIMTGKISANGNVTSILDNGDGSTITDLSQSSFIDLFLNCTSLTTAPILPSTGTMGINCYVGMFSGCTSLTRMPNLPGTVLSNSCYGSMFKGCTSLTKLRELPVMTLAEQCYSGMFNGCTSLTHSIELPATTLAENCYSSMFAGCTSLTEIKTISATTLANYCYSSMFNGCTSLTDIPASIFAINNLASYCYSGMFAGCTALTTIPQLQATNLVQYCYQGLFRGCTSLVNVPNILPAMNLAQYCYSAMFMECTSLTKAPELPATTLTTRCYYRMFYGCSSLNEIKIEYNGNFNDNMREWVKDVSSTGTLYYNGTDTTVGDSAIPTGWTVSNF